MLQQDNQYLPSIAGHLKKLPSTGDSRRLVTHSENCTRVAEKTYVTPSHRALLGKHQDKTVPLFRSACNPVRFTASVRLSVCAYETTRKNAERIFIRFDIWVTLRKLFCIIQFGLKSVKNNRFLKCKSTCACEIILSITSSMLFIRKFLQTEVAGKYYIRILGSVEFLRMLLLFLR